jgi:lysophospholipase L1-like esterase
MRFKISKAVLGVLVAVAFAGCVTTQAPHPVAPDTAFHITTTPYPQLSGNKNSYGGWWKDRFEQKVKLAAEGGFEVMFVGDSITHGIDDNRDNDVFDKMLAPAKIGNFGFSGDRTENVLWRFEHGNLSGKINPRVIMVMIGTNNTGHRMDKPEGIADGVAAIVSQLTEKFPSANILLLGIFPRGQDVKDAMRINNDKANEIIARLDGTANGHVHYLNINAKLLTADGVLARDIMPDLLHPNAKGYEIWANAVVPEIKKYLGVK